MILKKFWQRMKEETRDRKEKLRHEIAVERGEEKETLEEMIERYKNTPSPELEETEVDLLDLNGNGWLDAFEFGDNHRDDGYKWHV